MSTDLQQYIRQSRQAGKTDEQIRQELLSAGWREGDIKEALDITKIKVKINLRFLKYVAWVSFFFITMMIPIIFPNSFQLNIANNFAKGDRLGSSWLPIVMPPKPDDADAILPCPTSGWGPSGASWDVVPDKAWGWPVMFLAQVKSYSHGCYRGYAFYFNPILFAINVFIFIILWILAKTLVHNVGNRISK